ncbi:MAG TPA: RidA family protein [Micromonosporaceae bacterium]|nr:RidA family protein [Micromonosporaceae bacterium]
MILDNPSGVAAPFADRYANVARVDLAGTALLFLAGQVAVDEKGSIVGNDVVTQAERIFEIIEGLLAAHGATFDDVMHVRTYLTNMADLPGYGSVRRRIFTRTPPPASTTVEVSRLFLPEALLEVEVTAVAGSRH